MVRYAAAHASSAAPAFTTCINLLGLQRSGGVRPLVLQVFVAVSSAHEPALVSIHWRCTTQSMALASPRSPPARALPNSDNRREMGDRTLSHIWADTSGGRAAMAVERLFWALTLTHKHTHGHTHTHTHTLECSRLLPNRRQLAPKRCCRLRPHGAPSIPVPNGGETGSFRTALAVVFAVQQLLHHRCYAPAIGHPHSLHRGPKGVDGWGWEGRGMRGPCMFLCPKWLAHPMLALWAVCGAAELNLRPTIKCGLYSKRSPGIRIVVHVVGPRGTNQCGIPDRSTSQMHSPEAHSASSTPSTTAKLTGKDQ